jgi:hypothetical protein
MAERPDLDGRDPATFTELEKLAYVYPAVAELVRERDEDAALIRTLAAEIEQLRAIEQRARKVLDAYSARGSEYTTGLHAAAYMILEGGTP